MTFQNLRIVLFSCPYRPLTKMLLSEKLEMLSGKCQGILFPLERGNPGKVKGFHRKSFQTAKTIDTFLSRKQDAHCQCLWLELMVADRL